MRNSLLILVVILVFFTIFDVTPQSAYLYLNSTEYQMTNRTARKSYIYTISNNQVTNPNFYFQIGSSFYSIATGDNFCKLLTYNSATSNLINMVLYKSYTFTISNSGSPRKGCVFETPSTPIQILSTDITSSGSDKIVTVTTNANPANNNEYVYVNISLDDFATSKVVRQVIFATNSKTGSVTIPSSDFNNNSNYKFYVFTSPMALSSLNGAAQSTIDLATIDWDSVTYRALPVELSSFTGLYKDGEVKLYWSTATEISNCGFDVEQSTDKTNWTKIGFVKGNGNSNSTKDYSFVDKPSLSGMQYYRLKQIDADGKFEYSKMVEVSLGLPWTYKLSQNYPNPFNPSTKIDFSVPETGFYKLKVYNLAGQEVATLIEKEFAPGNYSVDFNGKHLPSGMYFYRLLGENVNIVKKMLLVK